MADGPVFGYDTWWGFGLQAAGQPKTAASLTNYWPLSADEGLKLERMIRLLDFADYRGYQTKWLSMGTYGAGTIQFPLIPGVVSNLLTWIQDRATEDDNQGRSATVVFNLDQIQKRFVGTKVRTATFDFTKNEVVQATLDVASLIGEDDATAYTPAVTATSPYIFTQAAFTYPDTTTDFDYVEGAQVVIDNVLETPEDGFRGDGGPYPACMYNLHGIRATGFLEMEFRSDDDWDRFRQGTEIATKIVCTSGANTCTLTMPRLIVMTDPVQMPGKHDVRLKARVEFTALGSADGTTAPITLS